MDKIKEMFGGHSGKTHDIPRQAEGRTDDIVDKGSEWAKDKTGGRYDDQIDRAAEEARKRTQGGDDGREG
ncbi:antitoxin [Spongiactinospora rosea]|uniref:Antitoxin n=1 Tax=Spongiactinospora rosea TaxID=2248750 RepID=A0A366LLK4_9ACTN|nr:antitoxin [Spongiactinospora rosea]RBQ14805.1 antitoxin [Spongiactinospora rosea]